MAACVCTTCGCPMEHFAVMRGNEYFCSEYHYQLYLRGDDEYEGGKS